MPYNRFLLKAIIIKINMTLEDEAAKADFEESLRRVRPSTEKTNISLEDFRKSYKKYEIKCSQTGQSKIYNHFFFFDNGNCYFNFNSGAVVLFYIPLFKERYGFSDDLSIRIKPKESDLKLNEESREVYAGILKMRNVPLNFILNSAGYIIDNSMLFSPEGTSGSEFENGKRALEIAGERYKPSGKETMTGMCAKSGDFIRGLLNSFNLPENIKYMAVSSRIDPFFHDTTLVFDINTGVWAAINSKSPRIPYNLVSKENLKKMGESYPNLNE